MRKYRAWYKDQMWDVKTLFLQERGSTGARLERDGQVEFPSQGQFILMESLYQHDKNEVLVYEGDIVKYRLMGVDVYEIVRWHGRIMGYEPFVGFFNGNDYVNIFVETVEVVGNQYQNPDLLEKVATDEMS